MRFKVYTDGRFVYVHDTLTNSNVKVFILTARREFHSTYYQLSEEWNLAKKLAHQLNFDL